MVAQILAEIREYGTALVEPVRPTHAAEMAQKIKADATGYNGDLTANIQSANTAYENTYVEGGSNNHTSRAEAAWRSVFVATEINAQTWFDGFFDNFTSEKQEALGDFFQTRQADIRQEIETTENEIKDTEQEAAQVESSITGITEAQESIEDLEQNAENLDRRQELAEEGRGTLEIDGRQVIPCDISGGHKYADSGEIVAPEIVNAALENQQEALLNQAEIEHQKIQDYFAQHGIDISEISSEEGMQQLYELREKLGNDLEALNTKLDDLKTDLAKYGDMYEYIMNPPEGGVTKEGLMERGMTEADIEAFHESYSDMLSLQDLEKNQSVISSAYNSVTKFWDYLTTTDSQNVTLEGMINNGLDGTITIYQDFSKNQTVFNVASGAQNMTPIPIEPEVQQTTWNPNNTPQMNTSAPAPVL